MKTHQPKKRTKLFYYLTTFMWIFLMIGNQAVAQTINIATAADLAKIGNDPNYPLNGNYKQTADINLSGYTKWAPIGTFTGTYDGQYHYIDNLTIHNTDEYTIISYQGLFSEIGESGEVKNLRMRNVNINLDGYSSNIGALAGYSRGKIHRVAVLSGTVKAYYIVGGLIGRQHSTGRISEAYSNTTVQSNGYIYVVPIPDPITGEPRESLGEFFGGLLGENQNGSQVNNSYATGSVTGPEDVGGLVGYNTAGSSISQSYASGNVNGQRFPGGLIGLNGGDIANSYWNMTTSGQSTSDGTGAVGKTDAEMKQVLTFNGWDFTNIWSIVNGISQPRLQWLDLSPLPVSLLNFTAQTQNNSAKLTWQTATETNNKEFIIYRSTDEGQFTEITRVEGAGNSNSLKTYNYYDKNPFNGNNYYKLVQVDNDGKETDLGTKILNFNLPVLSLQLYPNPTDDAVNISFNSNSYKHLILTDLNGKVLQEIQINPNEDHLSISLNKYAKGIYLLNLNGNAGSITRKILKSK